VAGPRLPCGVKLRRLHLLWRFPLKRRYVQAGNYDTALVIEPNHDLAALRIDAGVVGGGNPIAVPTAGHNEKRRERAFLQKLTDVADHANQPTRARPTWQAVQPENPGSKEHEGDAICSRMTSPTVTPNRSCPVFSTVTGGALENCGNQQWFFGWNVPCGVVCGQRGSWWGLDLSAGEV
jgi:hypothetical protein